MARFSGFGRPGRRPQRAELRPFGLEDASGLGRDPGRVHLPVELALERGGRRDAEDRDREEGRDAGDRVVDAGRRRPRPSRSTAFRTARGQGSDGDGDADAEDDEQGEEVETT